MKKTFYLLLFFVFTVTSFGQDKSSMENLQGRVDNCHTEFYGSIKAIKQWQIIQTIDNLYLSLNQDSNYKAIILNRGNATVKDFGTLKARIRQVIKFRRYDLKRIKFVNGDKRVMNNAIDFCIFPS